MNPPIRAKSRNNLAKKAQQLQNALREIDPQQLATITGARYLAKGEQEGEFQLCVWGQNMCISFPEFIFQDAATGKDLQLSIQTLVLYYFNTPHPAPQTDKWISFSELPDGKFYNSAFQGYTGLTLAKTFGNDYATFAKAASQIGGERRAIGDVAFRFQALPHIPVLVVCWLGDEDFAPSYNILFDTVASHYLPTDACAIMGNQLTQMLVKTRQKDNIV
ncbi:MAG: DUF3786 domain-containing protein [Chloroflexi bacterium]|nr:MAG: DUF3786 domain-containing protein [Chloroflexota bacterium]MBL1197216.1 DUF3786 domain-containing protein [Chloroflexota bacterium]NOH14511.1 DUF3786 domain-containing protein [Chloroflexota bacterium]